MDEQKAISLFGSKVVFQGDVSMDLYLNIASKPILKEDIYGQTLFELTTQLGVLSEILGATNVIRSACEGTDREAKPDDLAALGNVQAAADLLREVIVEKFSPRPR